MLNQLRGYKSSYSLESLVHGCIASTGRRPCLNSHSRVVLFAHKTSYPPGLYPWAVLYPPGAAHAYGELA